MKTWLTVAESAEYSGVSRDTIYTACERGELRHARVGGRRAIRIKPEWIDAWLEQHTQGAGAWRAAEQSSMHRGAPERRLRAGALLDSVHHAFHAAHSASTPMLTSRRTRQR